MAELITSMTSFIFLSFGVDPGNEATILLVRVSNPRFTVHLKELFPKTISLPCINLFKC